MSPADARVRAGWDRFNGPLEGHVDSLYLDTRDLETTADGILCDSPAAAQAMAWLRPDGTPATPAEIDAEWHRVKAMRPGLTWSRYRVGGYLHLAPEELERVTLARLDADVEILAAFWPDFASWPWTAQAAACALAWGCGAGSQRPGITSPDWPHFHSDVVRQDWRACAVSGQLSWTGNPGVRPRDLAVAALFLLAGGASWDEARAGWPAGSAAQVAEKALAGLGLPSAAGEGGEGADPPHAGESVAGHHDDEVGAEGFDAERERGVVGQADRAPDSAPADASAQEDGPPTLVTGETP